MSARAFIGTLNNPDETAVEQYIQAWKNSAKCVYACGQLEKGKEGTPHVQYYVHFSDKVRLAHLKKHCSKSHFEPVKRDNGAADYCLKTDTRLEGPWEFGAKPARRNTQGDMAARNARLLEIGPVAAVNEGLIPIEKFKSVKQAIDLFGVMAKKPVSRANLDNEWHWGATGTGKTKQARERFPEAFIKSNDVWWDGYQGEQTVIIDEMGPSQISGHHMKMWCDHYPFKAQTKGGCVFIRPQTIIVCSNYTIEECYERPQDQEPLKRRFKVHHYSEGIIKGLVP